ncbi:MAG: hypothetical protein JW819_07500 [Candidatus Krumholzibacteriota bacterium]|nr:hypothetical protein [Candidatus Krumholzibacteriota bacterium]
MSRRPVTALLLILLAAAPARALLVWDVATDPSELRSLDATDAAVWAAGRGGLVRLAFDGGISVFNSDDGLPTSDLNAVLATDETEIWVATAGEGLLRYRPADAAPWRRFQTHNALASDAVLCLARGPDGRIWYGTDAGLGVMEAAAPGSIWTASDGLGNETVRALAFVADTLYAGTEAGIYRLTPDTLVAEPGASAPAGSVGALVLAADSLWALAEGAVSRRPAAGGAWSALALPGGLAGYAVQALDAAGDTLALSLGVPGQTGREDRVYRYAPDAGTWTELPGLPADHYLGYTTVTYGALHAGADGQVWLGGAYSEGVGPGLLHWDGAAWEQEDLADHVLGADFLVMRRGPSGRTWALSRGGGAAWLGGAWIRYPSDPAFGGMPRFSLDMLEDGAGYAWFNRFTLAFGRIELATGAREVLAANRSYLAMGEDAAGNRWFCSDGAGIDVCDAGDQWHVLDTGSAGLPANIPDALAFLPDGRAALLFRGAGLQIWDANGTLFDPADDTWYHTGTGGGIADPGGYLADATAGFKLAAGPEGALWVAQDDGLVLVLPVAGGWKAVGRLGKKTYYGDGLLAPQVRAVAAAPDSSVWVGCDLGLARVAYRYDEAGGVLAWQVSNWTNEAGRAAAGADLFGSEVLSPLPSPRVGCLALSADGARLWVGTNGGAAVVDVLADPAPPPEALAGAYLYPNPVRAELGHDAVRLGGVEQAVNALVYNLEGQLVARPGRVAPGGVLWNLQTRFGNRAESGRYILRLEDRGAVATRILVLVR